MLKALPLAFRMSLFAFRGHEHRFRMVATVTQEAAAAGTGAGAELGGAEQAGAFRDAAAGPRGDPRPRDPSRGQKWRRVTVCLTVLVPK